METIGFKEAKAHLARLLERVTRGETVTITKNGVPVATLQPVDAAKKTPVRDVIEQLKRFRTGKRLEGLSLRGMIEENRR